MCHRHLDDAARGSLLVSCFDETDSPSFGLAWPHRITQTASCDKIHERDIYVEGAGGAFDYVTV